MEYIPIQKYYTDYEANINFEQVPYEREYEENHVTAIGEHVVVTKTITDYQTIQHTSYTPIQVPYTDYKQVEHRTEYIPIVNYETRVDYTPHSKVLPQLEYIPTQENFIGNDGLVKSVIVNKPQQIQKTFTDYIAQERVEKKVEYQAVTTQTVVAESTVREPQVVCPQPTQVVVQQSIHEATLNRPQHVVDDAVTYVEQVPHVSYQNHVPTTSYVPHVSYLNNHVAPTSYVVNNPHLSASQVVYTPTKSYAPF